MSEIDDIMRRKTRRALLTGGIASLAGLGAWGWLATREQENGIQWPLRRGLRFNEKLSRAIFSDSHESPRFAPGDAVKEVRVNEDIGMSEEVDPDTWMVLVGEVSVPLSEIKSMPKTEHVTELKCVEGWSQVVHWGGVRFRDFAAKYPAPAGREYVAFETQSGEYYVGLDLASAMHPDTLLCYEMSGEPLEQEHGAPLRLCVPTKYGIKNIKQLARIQYAVERPRDYWAERGYDWYAGL
jgi:DMSO/TMAO reductase YedYZ molybdopterin-dependent catalytic subunit